MEACPRPIAFHLPLARAYCTQFPEVSSLYDYPPFQEESFVERVRYLRDERGFSCPRPQLVQALKAYNGRIGNHAKALQNLEKFKEPEAVVVIGGQQPGLMTGPLYTIYKASSILSAAKAAEKQLGIPVVPVFWIAGEDHDWDEINHVHVRTQDHRLQKLALPRPVAKKQSISHLPFQKEPLLQWIQQFFESQLQTEHSRGLLQELVQLAEASASYSEFFARILVRLFGEDGLVLFDSADPLFRNLEGEMFARLIDGNEAIRTRLQESSRSLRERGYPPQVELDERHAHLFIYADGERLPLEVCEQGFRTRNSVYTYAWSIEELRNMALLEPVRFSCNVVTRPLMQEYLFPVLAFIAGPGEISYWGQYRKIFHDFGYRMPIILPRTSVTLSERHAQKVQAEYRLTFEDVYHRLDAKKEEWLRKQDDHGFPEQFARARDEIQRVYAGLIEVAAQINPGLRQLGNTNLDRVLNQLQYFENKTQQAFMLKHETVLKRFDRLKLSVKPEDRPQERVYNLFMFINAYGWNWWQRLKTVLEGLYPDGMHYEILL